MSEFAVKNSHSPASNLPKHTEINDPDAPSVNNNKTTHPLDPFKIDDAKAQYFLNAGTDTMDEAEAQSLIQQAEEFLENFAKRNPVYNLINELNSKLKQILRQNQQEEAEIRIGKYIAQLDTAIEKYHHTLEVAEKIKDLKDQAADKTQTLGIIKLVMGPLGSDSLFGSGISKVIEANAQYLINEAEKKKMDHEAINALLDGVANFLEKEGNLANSQFSLLESMYRSFSTLIDGLHRDHASTFSAMARTI